MLVIFLSRLFFWCSLAVLLVGCDRNADNEALSSRQELNPPAGAYVSAKACTQEDAACQTLVDLYERKPGFKESLISSLAAADITVPDWLPVALSTKLMRQAQESDSVVTGRACEPRNCAEFLYVAQNEASSRLYGFYRSNDRLIWFGEPDDADKALLCNAEQFCQLEPRQSEVRSSLAKAGYPEIVQLSDFNQCTEFKGGLSSRDGFVCRDQHLTVCPYTTMACTISSEFVGQQLAKIAFKYKFQSVKYGVDSNSKCNVD